MHGGKNKYFDLISLTMFIFALILIVYIEMTTCSNHTYKLYVFKDRQG